MKRKFIFEEKVLSSFFVVFILLGITVFIPTIQGSNVVEIIDSRNEELKNLREIFSKLNINNVIVSQDFEEYWSHYTKLLRAWESLTMDNMEEYWELMTRVVRSIIPIFTAIMGILGGYVGILANNQAIAWAVFAVALLIDFVVLSQYIRVYLLHWSYLETYSVDVVFQVCDENNTPINVYELGGNIEAYNVDAYDTIESTGEGNKEHFTYHVGPILTEGEEGIGYALSTWANLDRLEDWELCPPPPGVWNISISNVEGYKDTFFTTPVINKADCVYLTDIILTPE